MKRIESRQSTVEIEQKERKDSIQSIAYSDLRFTLNEITMDSNLYGDDCDMEVQRLGSVVTVTVYTVRRMYKSLEKSSQQFSSILVHPPILTWSDQQYSEAISGFMMWRVQYLTGNITSLFKTTFRRDIEALSPSLSTSLLSKESLASLTDRVYLFIDKYPHVDLITYGHLDWLYTQFTCSLPIGSLIPRQIMRYIGVSRIAVYPYYPSTVRKISGISSSPEDIIPFNSSSPLEDMIPPSISPPPDPCHSHKQWEEKKMYYLGMRASRGIYWWRNRYMAQYRRRDRESYKAMKEILELIQ